MPPTSKEQLEKLLELEKERRGFDKDRLVFIGMANVANYYWCAMRAYLKCREHELGFFGAYLDDRISYSLELGYIQSESIWPLVRTGDRELLAIGDNIGLNDIERLLRAEKERWMERSRQSEGIERDDFQVWFLPPILLDDKGNRVMAIDPDDYDVEIRELYESVAESEGIIIVDPEEYPILRGESRHMLTAESYPSIRWNFEWGGYVLLGIPDGITDDFVYEFKSTRNRFLMRFNKPIAFAQADLYGFFFKRRMKRVQIYVEEERQTETWMENVDGENAVSVLEKFMRVDQGELPPPPKNWKCKKCEYRSECPHHNK